jgi:hypothetical protein
LVVLTVINDQNKDQLEAFTYAATNGGSDH